MVVAPVDPRHAPFMSWLEKRGADIGPVELGKSALGDGYGVYATRALDEGETLFKIPSVICPSLTMACGDLDVGETLALLTAKGQGGPTVALAGILVKEWLCSKENGPRGPYLAMLPWDAEWPPQGEQEQEHILWWSEEQVDRLEGSSALKDAVAIRSEVNEAARVLVGLLGASIRKAVKERGDPVWKQWDVDDEISKAARGAFVSILSRSFEEAEEDKESRLVPFLDMLQHTDDPNVRHVTITDEETGKEAVIAETIRPIAAGEELTFNYNNKLTPEQFLTNFGFVPGKSVGGFIDSLPKSELPFGLRFF
jgi:hypothetical protein